MIRFFLVFLLLLPTLLVLELTGPVQEWLVLPWTSLLTRISAFLLRVFDPGVLSYGKVLMDAKTGIGVSVEAGCNGIEACLILIAAMAAYPAGWKMKLAGLLAGSLAVQAVNVLRVVSLFYLARWNKEFFEFAHLYLWQALIMIDVLVVWLVWIRLVARQASGDAPPPSGSLPAGA
ncbi:MAG: exosortase H [Zoogloea sp.]|nr:MAG: exosortase H [Zoogloea sp.]